MKQITSEDQLVVGEWYWVISENSQKIRECRRPVQGSGDKVLVSDHPRRDYFEINDIRGPIPTPDSPEPNRELREALEGLLHAFNEGYDCQFDLKMMEAQNKAAEALSNSANNPESE